MTALKKTGRRLRPEVRRSLILDHTADIIAKDGVAALSMERIAKTASISKSLVYAYFPNLTSLLQNLLTRELKQLRRLQTEAAETSRDIPSLVRNVTHVYLKYIEERGLIIHRLQAEPSVVGGTNPTHYARDESVDYLAEIVSRTYNISMDEARMGTDISFGLPAAAGEYLYKHKVDRQLIEDQTVKMILGAIQSLKR